MANGRRQGSVLRPLERLFQDGSLAGQSEGQLLDRFVVHRDPAAFAALMARHGPTVLGVCRRVLCDPNDVDDAFQATFLVLVRKAGSLRDRRLLGNWLYGVALRVARRARGAAGRRRVRETVDLAALGDRAAPRDDSRAWLLEEIERLPYSYRVPILLCYFEGLSHEEAAQRLGWPIGTVKGRLARARERLRARLSRDGMPLSSGALADRLASDSQAAPVPESLSEMTIIAAQHCAAGQAAASGIVSAGAAALTEGVVRTMLVWRLKLASSALAVGALITAGAVLAGQQSRPAPDGAEDFTVKPIPTGSKPESADSLIGSARERERRQDEEVFRQLLDVYKDGKPADLDRVHRWSQHVLEAQLTLCVGDGDRVAAQDDHRRRMKRLHELTQQLSGPDQYLKADTARSYALEAERALAETQQKPATAADPAPALPGPAGAAGRTLSDLYAGKNVAADSVRSRPADPKGVRPTRPPYPTLPSAGTRLPALAEPATTDLKGPMKTDLGRVTIARLVKRAEETDGDPRSRSILKKLDEPISMSFASETPLEDVLKYIRSATAGPNDTGITVYVDPQGLKDVGQTLTSPVTMDLEAIPLKTSLRLLLKQLDLAYCVKDGMLMISSVRGILEELAEAEAGGR